MSNMSVTMTSNLDGFSRVDIGDLRFAKKLQRHGWTGEKAYRHVGEWCEFLNSQGEVIGKAKYDNTSCTSIKYIKG